MIDERDPRVRELFYELLDTVPSAPEFSDLRIVSSPRSRRVALRIAGVVLAALVIGVGTAILVEHAHTSKPTPPSVRVETPGKPQPTLVYADPAKPPPIRVIAGTRSVDVTTVLGCWSHVPGDAAGHGVGVCTDGSVDPSMFRLDVRPRTRIVIQLPIEADLAASLGDPPARPAPHALAAPVTNRRPVRLTRDGPTTWSFTFTGANHDLALLIDLTANTSVGHVRVSGTAYYGLTLVIAS
jgi:hypothetical protein